MHNLGLINSKSRKMIDFLILSIYLVLFSTLGEGFDNGLTKIKNKNKFGKLTSRCPNPNLETNFFSLKNFVNNFSW